MYICMLVWFILYIKTIHTFNRKTILGTSFSCLTSIRNIHNTIILGENDKYFRRGLRHWFLVFFYRMLLWNGRSCKWRLQEPRHFKGKMFMCVFVRLCVCLCAMSVWSVFFSPLSKSLPYFLISSFYSIKSGGLSGLNPPTTTLSLLPLFS